MSTASHRDLLLLPAASPITEAQGQGQAQAQAQARTATPTRPAHRRGFSTDGTPNHRPLRSLARGTPNNSSSPAALSPLLSLFDPENTPRKKPQLPSPPNSESTSSGSTHHPAGAAPPSDQLAMDSPLDNRPRSSWTGSLASRSRRGADADADSSAELTSLARTGAPETPTSSALLRQGSGSTLRNADAAVTYQTSRSERRRRSAMHEQEVSQIRSESRAGLYDDDLDEEDEKPGAGPNEADRWRGVQVANQRGSFIRKPGTTPSRAYSERDASMDRDSGLSTDTSGTEGAGSTTSRRRHKKSSDDGRRELASARRNRESRLAADREGGSAQGSTSFRSLRARNGTPSSPLSEELSIEPSVGGRRYSPRRNGIPREFLYQDERQPLGADRDVEDEEDADALEGRSMESSGTAGRSSRATQAWTSGNRRKRYPSDAGTASDPIPQFDYGGRGGSQESRLSVDSSLAYRYLTRGGGAASSLGLGRLVDPPEGEEEDGVRSRKVSTSSSISARSSGGASASASASELHRSASRASMRLAHRRDVFDDEAPVSPFGPNVSTAQQRSPLRDGRAMGERERMERIRELRESGERLRLREKEGGAGRAGWVNELDELRSRIEELSVSGARGSDTRSPGVASATLGRHPSLRDRARSSLDHTYARSSLDLSSAARPSTEPRKQQNQQQQRHRQHLRSATMSEIDPQETSERMMSMRDFDEEESPRFSFPTRSGAGAGAGADRSVRPMTSQGGNWDHRDRDREPSTPDPMLSSLSRPDSRSRAVRSAMLPAVAGGRFPSGSFNAIHGGIHGRSQSGPGPATPSGTGLAHDRNMHNAFEMFNRHFSGSQSGGQGQGQGQTPQSPSTPGSSSGFGAAATPESAEMVARFNEVTDTASRLNAGLRALIQTTLEAQIDAELNDPGRGGVGDGANVAAAMAFREIDRGLNSLLKLSDDQVRNLTEGLIAFTRAERERDRLRKALNMDSGSVGGRPGSRLSSLGAAAGGSASTATSPAEPRRSSRDLISDRRGAGASGTEGLRRAASVRDYPSPTGTVIEHESGGPRSDRSGQSGKAGANERARVSLARPLGGAAGIGGMMSPTLPYSPTPLPGNNRGVGSGGNTLPSRMHASALGSGSLHGRSASELSPSSHSTMGAGAGSGTGRSREKSSANSTSSTIRPPSQLSPRRPKLSFPTTSVSNATASFSASASSVGDDGSAGGSLIAFPSREERREERREARQDARDARDPTGTFSLTRAREFASEPVALNLSSSQSSGTSHATAVAGSNSRGDGAAAETSPSASATSSLVGSAGKGAAPPPRRNTISVGLGVGSDRLRGGNESGRVGTGAGVRAPPPRPPRHDLMQVDVDDEDDAGGHDGVADSSISNKSRRSRAFPQTPQTASAISRFGALGLGNMVSRSLGRGAGRRISAAFEPGQVQVQGGSGSAQADAELETEGGGPGETEMSADEEFGRLKRRASRSASRNALRDNDRTVGARGSASGSGTVRRSGAVPGA